MRDRLGEIGLAHSEDMYANDLSGGLLKRPGELIEKIHEELMPQRMGKRPHLPAFT